MENSNKPKLGRDLQGQEEDSALQKKTSFFRKPTLKKKQAREGDEESDTSTMSVESRASSASSRSVVKRSREAKEGGSDPESKRFLKGKECLSGDEVFDPSVPPSNARTKAKLPKVDDLGTEMMAQPTEELVASIKAQLDTVEKIADKSKNMRRDYIHGLRIAVRTVFAAAGVLVDRGSTDANVQRLERDNAELRARMAELEAKVQQQTEASTRDSAARVAKPATSQPFAGGKEWEDRFMERVSGLIERKLSAVFKTPSATSQSGGAPAKVRASPRAPPTLGPSPKTPSGGKGKAKSNRELVTEMQPPTEAPAPSTSVPETWAKVTSKSAKRRQANKSTPKTGSKAGTKAAPKGSPNTKPKPGREPTSSAITITVPEGSDVTYASVMAQSRSRIDLADIGIGAEDIQLKKTLTGGVLLGVSGVDCGPKADVLAERMRKALTDLGVRITRPVKMAELRLRDLDDSVECPEVAAAVAKAGECSVEDVKVGAIRRTPTAMGTAWVRCPLTAVRKLVAAGHITVGWVKARLDYLESRPLQCFRCLEHGHVCSMCQSTVDRTHLCYACGEPGHRASQCTRTPKCPLCSDLGRRADHRLGTKQCSPPKKGKAIKKPAGAKDPAPTTGGNTAPIEATVAPGPGPPPQELMEAS